MRITLIKKLFFKSSPKRVHAHKHKRQPTALHKIHKLISNENTTDTCTAYHCSHQTQFLKNKSAPKWSSSPGRNVLDWTRAAQWCQLHHQSCNPLDPRGKAKAWSTEDNLAKNCGSGNEEHEPQLGHHPEAG